MSKLLILANHYNTLRIFRRELLEALHDQGHELIVSMPPCDQENAKILESYGCRLIPTPEMERRGINPLHDIKLLKRYQTIIKKEKPKLVIAYTVKCNIYGALACKRTRTPFFANVTGLGSAFQPGHAMMRTLVTFLYRFSLTRARGVFFENIHNQEIFINRGIIRTHQAILMPGAGVNLTEFHTSPYPEETSAIRFLFIGRIMQEKGVDELFAAIRHIHSRYPQVIFDFIGWYEDAYQHQTEQMQKEGLIRFHGFQAEVRPFIEKSHCIILPSWHEGMSNALLEAAAMARPLITNRIHGCMEAVQEDSSGYLCTKQDVGSLTSAIERFIQLTWEQKRQMGLAGRKHMENHFDKQMVVKQTITKLGLA